MAVVISLYFSSETPLPSETPIARVSMSRADPRVDAAPGFRVSARSPEGRTLGRWVGDCPIAVAMTASLWLTAAGWQMEFVGPLNMGAALQAEAPIMGMPESAPHRDALEILARHFPGSAGDAAERPTRQEVSRPTPPKAEPPLRGSQVNRRQIEMIPSSGGDDRKRQLAMTLSVAARDLRSGLSVDDVSSDLAEKLLSIGGPRRSPDEDLDGLDDLDDDGLGDDGDDGAGAGGGPALPEGPSREVSTGHRVAPASGLRPLGRYEVPPGLSADDVAALQGYSAGSGYYDKLERTRAREHAELSRVRSIPLSPEPPPAPAPPPPDPDLAAESAVDGSTHSGQGDPSVKAPPRRRGPSTRRRAPATKAD